MDCNNWVLLFFGLTALTFSIFYGAKGIAIFNENDAEKFGKYRKWHKRWFNFLGSIIGWIALWMLLPKPICDILRTIENGTPDISLSNILLFFLFFIGVTGYLPVTIVGVVLSIGELFQKAIDRLK